MRILVLSDIHARRSLLYKVFAAQPQAAACFFLGDGERDFDALCADFPKILPCADTWLFKVRGNCDFRSSAPDSRLEILYSIRIFATHGHLFTVKQNDDALLQEAETQKASIAVYGHTHRAVHRYVNGIHLFNPGAIADGAYGVIDCTDAGIICLHMQV